MEVKSIAECSQCSLGAFYNTFDLRYAIISLEKQFFVFFLSGCLRHILLYLKCFYLSNRVDLDVMPLSMAFTCANLHKNLKGSQNKTCHFYTDNLEMLLIFDFKKYI